MTQRVCVHLDEDAADLLREQLAPSPRKQGEYFERLDPRGRRAARRAQRRRPGGITHASAGIGQRDPQD